MAQHTFTSFKAYAEELRNRADGAKPKMFAATRTATIYFHTQSVRRLTRYVYSVPVPTALRRSERRNRGQGSRMDIAKGATGSVYGWRMRTLTKPKNKPLWKRTGLLRFNELFEVVNYSTGRVYNATVYAVRRHWLKKTRFPGQIMAPAPWQHDTFKDKSVRDRIATIYGGAGFSIVSGEGTSGNPKH